VDEYGGTSGIVTLEDVIEEIVGEINDEFDDDDVVYSKLDDNNYVFEGKAHLNDIYRILVIDGEVFEDAKGEADTLGGLILELEERIPKKGEKIRFENLLFTIEAADNRKIKRVKITIDRTEEEDED
jgi:putative hemolysin